MTHWAKVTDKVEPHGYFPSYLKLAAEIGPYGTVCEVGVAGGGSLDMWQQLLPLGVVVGVDSNGNSTWPGNAQRVNCDAQDPQLPGVLKGISESYDLIVDDCNHEGHVSQALWDALWPLVKPGGYYVVEDWNGAFANSRQPGAPYTWGEGLLAMVANLLRQLHSREAECDVIEYRYGLAIVHKRAT